MKTTLRTLLSAAAFVSFVCDPAALHAGSATWNLNPTSGDWNTAANWTPATVPNAPTDIATFATSGVTQLSLSNDISLDSLVFGPGADSFSVTTVAGSLSLYGAGVVNNSGQTQYLNAMGTPPVFKGIGFSNSSSAGTDITYTVSTGGGMVFEDSATAGNAHFVVSGTKDATTAIYFFGNSTAGNGTFTLEKGSLVNVSLYATAGQATFHVTGGTLVFSLYSRADQSIIDCSEGGTVAFGPYGTIDEAFTTAHGGIGRSSAPGTIYLYGAVEGEASFVVEGGVGRGARGGRMVVLSSGSSLGFGTVTVAGGTSGGLGGSLVLRGRSDGGTARLSLSGNAVLDFSRHDLPPVGVGSIEGEGSVVLGAIPVSVGTNNLSTTFSGVIQDGDARPGIGPLMKVGSGTLTLSGANTYVGGTAVTGGALSVTNLSGSATGTGPVIVSGALLGGTGIIGGAVTIGNGAFLQPSLRLSQPASLTVQGSVTFTSGSTYTYKLDTKKAKADQVVANGVTLETGAQFDFDAVGNSDLTVGKVFTAIDNASPDPISGTFANLPDDSKVTVGQNTFQASYEGGDGNDLTLTVVP